MVEAVGIEPSSERLVSHDSVAIAPEGLDGETPLEPNESSCGIRLGQVSQTCTAPMSCWRTRVSYGERCASFSDQRPGPSGGGHTLLLQDLDVGDLPLSLDAGECELCVVLVRPHMGVPPVTHRSGCIPLGAVS